MLRPSQHLCRQALARPIGRSLLRETGSSRCLRATRTARARPSQDCLSSPRPRSFTTTSHWRLASPSKSPQEQGAPSATATAPIPTEAVEAQFNDAPPSPNPQAAKPRRKRGLYYAAVFLLLGTAAGTVARMTIAPPALPAAGSEKDAHLKRKIQAQGAALPIVQELSADASWTSWDAYAGISEAPTAEHPRGLSHAAMRVTSGPMSGASGLAFQRVFHRPSTGEVIAVVYLGPALAGWPGVVHGGALATLLDESVGRCAVLRFPTHTGVTATLDLSYRAPTLTNSFYVIRTRPIPSHDDDVVDKDGVRKGDRKLWVHSTLETVKGKVAVEAKGLFVVPKGYPLESFAERF